ncbi:hypothetical protein GGS20DRAFT_483316 [Poronia punctata]|nr:hypothetical protein GGS20DRAFT_483316 [Poronia punctata]
MHRLFLRVITSQSVERETLNLKVAGSTPALGSIPDALQLTGDSSLPFFFLLLFFSALDYFNILLALKCVIRQQPVQYQDSPG